MMVKQIERFYLFCAWNDGDAWKNNTSKFLYKVSTMFDSNQN